MAGPTLQETTARVLALPREAGTAEAAEARELVAAYLKGLGYRVTEQRFRFHPASLLAFPVFGAGLGGLTLLTLPLLLFDGPPDWAAFALASIGLGALALLAIGIGVGWMPIGGEMREDANLLAVRSASTDPSLARRPSRYQGASAVDGGTPDIHLGRDRGYRHAPRARVVSARRNASYRMWWYRPRSWR